LQSTGKQSEAQGADEAAIISGAADDDAGDTPDSPLPGGSAGKTDPALSPNGMNEELKNNVVANRRKRWSAFIFIGLVVAAFFGMLLTAFYKLFFGTYLVEAITAANDSWQWHVLVFLGVALVLLAAIPLSLSLAMVKMIEDGRQEESGSGVKTPSVELVKALADIFKAVASSIKS